MDSMRERNVILAVDMGGTAWKAAVMSEGRALAFGSLPNRSVVDDLSELADLFRRLLQEAGSSLKECLGLGISLAEIVDSNEKSCPSPCYKHPYFQGNNIETVVRGYIDLPVEVDNDARAALLGEEAYGVLSDLASGTDNVLMVTLATGIGVAARVNGELVRGAHSTGGTLGGHITVDINGPVCICGNRGCAEALASGYAMTTLVPQQPWFVKSTLANEKQPTFQMLTDAVRQGDPFANQGLDGFREVWTSLLVSLIHVFDPPHVVLSGGFTRSADLFLQTMTISVRDRLWDSRIMPEVLVAKDPELSGIRGGEVLVRSARHEYT